MPLRFSIWPLNQRRFLSLLLFAGGFGLSDPPNTVTHTKLSSITEPPLSLIIKNDGTRTLIFSCDHHDYFRFFFNFNFNFNWFLPSEIDSSWVSWTKIYWFLWLGQCFFFLLLLLKIRCQVRSFLWECVYVCVFKCNPGLRMRMRLRSED